MTSNLGHADDVRRENRPAVRRLKLFSAKSAFANRGVQIDTDRDRLMAS